MPSPLGARSARVRRALEFLDAQTCSVWSATCCEHSSSEVAFLSFSSRQSAMTFGTTCGAHPDCDLHESGEYCASLSGGAFAGACRSCIECAFHADGIDGACPRTCASRNLTDGIGAASEGEFFEDYAYWVKVRDGEEISSGCTSSAREATKTTTANKKGMTLPCSGPFRKRASDRWCAVDVLTLEFPYARCIADGENDYCGVGSREVCVGERFDCCPLRAGPIAGLVTAVSLVLLVVQFYIYRAYYRRRLIRKRTFWNDPKLVEAAKRACERFPILAAQESSRELRAIASEKKIKKSDEAGVGAMEV